MKMGKQDGVILAGDKPLIRLATQNKILGELLIALKSGNARLTIINRPLNNVSWVK